MARTMTEEQKKAWGAKMKEAREAKKKEKEAVIIEKKCLFCGVESKLTRQVNLRTVVLCEEHYYDKNIGQIAEQLNKES
jgi:hypothetical protein